MKYLKIINCHFRGALPEKPGSKAIDWASFGANTNDVRRYLLQGKDQKGDYVQCIPIADAAKLNEQYVNIIDKINNNNEPRDSAEIIDQVKYDILKAEIEAIKKTEQEANSGSALQ